MASLVQDGDMKAPSVCTANLAACVPPRALLTGCLHGMHMSSLLSLLWSKPTGFSQEETSARLTGCFFQGCPDGKTCHKLDQALPWTVLQTSQETSCPLTFTPRCRTHDTFVSFCGRAVLAVPFITWRISN